MKRSISLVAVLALLSTTLAILMPSAVLASYWEGGVSFSTRIVRGSVRYKLNVKAIRDIASRERLEVSISKLRDPAGPTALRQKQTWVYELEYGDLDWDGDDTYRIDAGSDDGPFRVNVTVKPIKDARCSRHQRLFVTEPEDGAFRIETGNKKFGTIEELPRCGKSWSYANGSMPGPPPCPLAGVELWSPVLSVSERRDSEKVRINTYKGRERTVAGARAQWSVEVKGTLPATRFRLRGDLRGSLRARGAPWLSGRAWFRPKKPLRSGDWYDCKRSREARSVQRSGVITGDLVVAVIGYATHRIRAADAEARRSWVRPRL